MDISFVSSPGDERAWTEFVAIRPDALLAHRPQWHRAAERHYRLEPRHLIARAGGEVVGVLPLGLMRAQRPVFPSWISSGAYTSAGGILALSHDARDALVRRALDVALDDRVDYLLLKNLESPPDRFAPLEGYYTLEVDLDPDPEVVFRSRMRGKARNQLRKARRLGVTAEVGGFDLLPDYYEIYCARMRELGTPPHGLAYVAALLDAFAADARIILARHGGRAVAGVLLFLAGGVAYLQSSVSLARALPLCPNHVSWWAAVDLACRRGCRKLDLGRSRMGAGAYRFKRQWGGAPVPLGYQVFLNRIPFPPAIDPAASRYRIATRLWRHLPRAITDALGPRFIRFIP